MLNHYVKIFYLIVLLVYLLIHIYVFLYILSYLFVTTGKFLCPNFSSIFFSFIHNVLTLSTITSMPSFSSVVLAILIVLYVQKKKTNFYYLHKVVNHFIYTKKIIFYYLPKVVNNFLLLPPMKITHSFFNFYIFNGNSS